MNKLDEKVLQAKLLREDSSVKLGDTCRREDLRLVLVMDEATEEFKESGKAACTHCRQLLSTGYGAHIKRHFEERCKKRKREPEMSDSEEPKKNRKVTEFNFKKYRDVEVKKLTEALAKYALRSGRSFNSMSSSAMKNFVKDVSNAISSGYGETAMDQLPCRQTIQKHCETLAKEMMELAYEKIRPFIGKRVNFLVDHGRLVVNYLSIYGSFIDEHFKLQMVPLAFMPAMDGKSGKETTHCIVERLQLFGFIEDEILSCSVTADGALSTLRSFFRSYNRCVNHSLNLVCQHAVEPLECHAEILTDVIEELNIVKDIFKIAHTVSSGVRQNSTVCQLLSRLPALPIETRWMNSLKCLKDVHDLSEDFQQHHSLLSKKVRSSLEKLNNEYSKKVNSILAVLGPLLQFNQVFQTQTSVTLHIVLPTYKLLESKWDSILQGTDDDLDPDNLDLDTMRALCRAGLALLPHYYKEFSDIHYAAVFLSPKTKKMKNFKTSEVQIAHSIVAEMMPKEVLIPMNLTKPSKSTLVGDILDLVRDPAECASDTSSEMEKYLSEHIDQNYSESVEDFWNRKQGELPKLYDVAARVFSIVPSESVCESAFSQAAFLLDKRRTRLQYTRAELVVLGTQIAQKFPEFLN